jgi:hypothetical protein
MADQATWAKRVAEWRASGRSSVQFCAGRDFTPGGLRNAAHQLDHASRPRKAPPVRIARVVSVPAPAPPPPPEVPVLVELGGARITVQRGFDQATLAAVLDVLASRGGAA